MSRAKTSEKGPESRRRRPKQKNETFEQQREIAFGIHHRSHARSCLLLKLSWKKKRRIKGKLIQLVRSQNNWSDCCVEIFRYVTRWKERTSSNNGSVFAWQRCGGLTNKLFGWFSVKLSLRSRSLAKSLEFALCVFFFCEWKLLEIFCWNLVLNKQAVIMRQLVRSITYYKTNICVRSSNDKIIAHDKLLMSWKSAGKQTFFFNTHELRWCWF